MIRIAAAAHVLLAGAVSASAQPATKEVVVLTSFPKELFEGYKQAFEQKAPGVKVIVKQQQTNQGVTYLRETRNRPEADIFWARQWTPSRPSRPTACSRRSRCRRRPSRGSRPRSGAFRSTTPTATTGASRSRRPRAAARRISRWCPRSTRAPKGYPNPFTMKLGGVDFDDKLSSSRRNVVNALFDQVVTFRHAELKAAWGSIYGAEAQVTKARGGGRNVEAAVAQLAEARKLASAVPLDARRASDREVNAAFKDKPEVKSRMETEWDTAAKASYARARERAEGAAAKIR